MSLVFIDSSVRRTDSDGAGGVFSAVSGVHGAIPIQLPSCTSSFVSTPAAAAAAIAAGANVDARADKTAHRRCNNTTYDIRGIEKEASGGR